MPLAGCNTNVWGSQGGSSGPAEVCSSHWGGVWKTGGGGLLCGPLVGILAGTLVPGSGRAWLSLLRQPPTVRGTTATHTWTQHTAWPLLDTWRDTHRRDTWRDTHYTACMPAALLCHSTCWLSGGFLKHKDIVWQLEWHSRSMQWSHVLSQQSQMLCTGNSVDQTMFIKITQTHRSVCLQESQVHMHFIQLYIFQENYFRRPYFYRLQLNFFQHVFNWPSELSGLGCDNLWFAR